MLAIPAENEEHIASYFLPTDAHHLEEFGGDNECASSALELLVRICLAFRRKFLDQSPQFAQCLRVNANAMNILSKALFLSAYVNYVYQAS